MAWQIRPLTDASARIRGAFRQYMPGTDSALGNNFVTVLGKVLAGLSHEFELRMAYLSRQMFLSSATGRFLQLHAGDVGISESPLRPLPARSTERAHPARRIPLASASSLATRLMFPPRQQAPAFTASSALR